MCEYVTAKGPSQRTLRLRAWKELGRLLQKLEDILVYNESDCSRDDESSDPGGCASPEHQPTLVSQGADKAVEGRHVPNS